MKDKVVPRMIYSGAEEPDRPESLTYEGENVTGALPVDYLPAVDVLAFGFTRSPPANSCGQAFSRT